MRKTTPQTGANLDIGFRVLKIQDNSVFEPINETQSRIRDFYSEEDALFELMTRVGIDLGAAIECVTLSCGKRVWLAGNLDALEEHLSGKRPPKKEAYAPEEKPPPPLLIACLERSFQDVHPRRLMLEIASTAVPNNTVFVFLDAAFGAPENEEWQLVRANFLARLKQNDISRIISL